MTNTQQLVPIDSIRDNLVFLKDGSVSLVITTSAVNFGLLFETEQIAIIQSFAGLLNSLSFPIQIVIRSQRLDISSYLLTLDQALKKQTNPLLANLTAHYRGFVESMIKEKNVLDKQFFVCLNISSYEMGILPKNPVEKAKKALAVLSPRRDHILHQLFRLGLKAKQLDTAELVKLFYSIYNTPEEIVISPEFGLPAGRQGVRSSATKQEINQPLITNNHEPITPSINIPRPVNIPFAPPPTITSSSLSLRAEGQPIAPLPASPAFGVASPKLQRGEPTPHTQLIAQLHPPFVVEELPDE